MNLKIDHPPETFPRIKRGVRTGQNFNRIDQKRWKQGVIYRTSSWAASCISYLKAVQGRDKALAGKPAHIQRIVSRN